MNSFFEDGVYESISTRLNQLDKNSSPQWGKMTVGQMLYHCQIPLNVILKKNTYDLKPNWLVNLLFKKSMYSDKLWKQNMPTAKGFKITDTKDFDAEKNALHQLIDELHAQRHRKNWQPHPAFGELTKEQWGKMQYKHLDHHFRQFGV